MTPTSPPAPAPSGVPVPAAASPAVSLPLLPVSPLDARPFRCPGERQAITAPLHYQRLASGYAACRDCPHRSDAGSLTPERIRRWTSDSPSRSDRFRENGIRGIVPNDLSMEALRQLAHAVGDTVWCRRGPTLSSPPALAEGGTAEVAPVRRRPPVVVVGYDTRAQSPRLHREFVLGLRESGVQVLDAGRVPRPALQFAVDHWRADAGVSVTGAGAAHHSSGLDLFSPGGEVWSLGNETSDDGQLSAVAASFRRPATRHARSAGTYQPIDSLGPYIASLQRHLHGQRPLQIGCAVDDPILAGLIDSLLTGTPLRSTRLTAEELAAAQRRGAFDLGLEFAEDGASVRVFDENGDPLSMLSLAAHLAEGLLADWSHVTVAAASGVLPEPEWSLATRHGGTILFHDAGTSHEGLVRAMREFGDQLGVDGDGRLWLRDSEIACDGLLTAIHIFRLLSNRAEPASWLRHVPGLPIAFSADREDRSPSGRVTA